MIYEILEIQKSYSNNISIQLISKSIYISCLHTKLAFIDLLEEILINRRYIEKYKYKDSFQLISLN